MSDAAFRMEIPGLAAFSAKWRTATPSLMDELTGGFLRGTKIVQRSANALIKGGESSRLAQASTVNVTVSAQTITGTVSYANARSKTGFPYAAAYNGGRRAFGPVNAKALHFVIDGRDIFTMHVKAFPGTRFMQRGLAAAKGAVVAEIQSAIGRWKAQMA